LALNPKKIVAVDVGSTVVKVAQLKKTSVGYELLKIGWAEVVFSRDSDNSVNLNQARSEAVRRAIKDAGITCTNAVSSLNGDNAIVRFIQLPEMPPDELKSALQWEAQDLLPFPVEEVVLDYKTLASTSMDQTADKVEVLVAAAKKDIIAEHETILQGAQLTPISINIDTFALLRAFDAAEGAAQRESIDATVLLNLGASQTNLVITSSGIPRFVRDIAISGNTISEVIAQRLNCSFQRAEQLKAQYGIPDADDPNANGTTTPAPDETNSLLLHSLQGTIERRLHSDETAQNSPDIVVDAVILQILGNLAKEVLKTISFYENMNQDSKVTRIVLAGGGAQMEGILGLFKNETKLQCSLFNPLANIKTSSITDAERTATMEKMSVALGVVIGLGIQVFDDQNLNKSINVILSTNKKKSSIKQSSASAFASNGQMFSIILALLGFLFLIICGGIAYSYLQLQDVMKQKDEVVARLEKNKALLKKSEDDLVSMTKLNEEIENKFSIISSLAPPDRIYWSEKLNMLAKARTGASVFLDKIGLQEVLDSVETEESKTRHKTWEDRKATFEKSSKGKRFTEPEPPKVMVPLIKYTLTLHGIASGKDSSERLSQINSYADSLAAMTWERDSGEKVKFMDGFYPEYRFLEQETKVVGGVNVMSFGLAFDAKPPETTTPLMKIQDLVTTDIIPQTAGQFDKKEDK